MDMNFFVPTSVFMALVILYHAIFIFFLFIDQNIMCMTYDNRKTKQHCTTEYLCCCFIDESFLCAVVLVSNM